MPLNKPLLIFDGDCTFCRAWIARWHVLTGDAVTYAPSQEVASQFPDIPPADFQKSIQLVEPDGKRTSGAQAVFRALELGSHPRGAWAYARIPGFRGVSEWAYAVIAGNRPVFSWLTRLIWGNPAEPESYRRTRWIFLRALALNYAIAFGSLGLQIKGLVGSQGILPVQELLTHLTSRFGMVRFWYLPTLAWINASDLALVGQCAAGLVFSVLLLLNIAPRLSLFVLWSLYLSLVSIGGPFLSFQWDALLLETGFLAIFLAPAGILPQRNGAEPPSSPALFLLKWLLFRLMLMSSLVKWMSGDTLWRTMNALTVHFQTQPLPGPLAWYAHHLPTRVLQLSCVLMFFVEGLVPLLIFAPRRIRRWAFIPLAGLQVLILLTGNYTYFNLLTISLSLLLLDDSVLRPWSPSFYEEPLTEPGPASRWGRLGVIGGLVLTVPLLLGSAGFQVPGWMMAPTQALSPLRSFNPYGLFAVMTPKRPEIIVEGTRDGKTWVAYDFKHKPGELHTRPTQVAPHQPRLDWQMWFAALGDIRQNQWFLAFCARLLQGSHEVTKLLAWNPFPDQPPVAVRAWVYDYRFTTPAERRQTHQWWIRELLGRYSPDLSLKPSK